MPSELTTTPTSREMSVEAATVEPLRKRTMTLNDLQLRTANFLRLCKFQLRRAAHEDGMSDEEFIEQQLEPFETDIYQDRQMLKMLAKRKKEKR